MCKTTEKYLFLLCNQNKKQNYNTEISKNDSKYGRAQVLGNDSNK
jgi:hypothetical protein